MNLHSKKIIEILDIITLVVPFIAAIAFFLKMINRRNIEDEIQMYFYLGITITTILVRLVFVVTMPALIQLSSNTENQLSTSTDKK